MLDEIVEFSQYTFPLDTDQPENRLKHRQIRNKLGGIERAMTIIARKLYFDNVDKEKEVDKDVDKKDRVKIVKNGLQLWCGDPEGKENLSHPGITKNWLPDYIVSVLGKPKVQKYKADFDKIRDDPDAAETEGYQFICDVLGREDCNIRDFREKQEVLAGRKKPDFSEINNLLEALGSLDKKYNTYNVPLFEKKPRKGNNSYKEITYDIIIASAADAGPLSRYYLVCEKDDFSKIKFKSEPIAGKTKKSQQETAAKRKDLAMKTVAAVLLEQKARGAKELYQGFVPINKTDIVNWSVRSMKPDDIKEFNIDGRELFKSESLNNVVFVEIDSEWADACRWDVIKECELDQYLEMHPKAVFFSDPGGDRFLEKNKRYEEICRGDDAGN